jgi:hypothetical protein
MARSSASRRLSVVAVTAALALAGCESAAPPAAGTGQKAAHGHDHNHDHADHDHPETLAEGVAQLAEAAAAVEKHLASGATDAADEVVHGVGHIIEDIQGLLPKENRTAEAKAAAAKALDEVFECFDKLDTALHAPAGKGEPPAEVHAGLKNRIDAAIKALKDAL